MNLAIAILRSKKFSLIILLLSSLNNYSQDFNGGVLIGFTASQVDGDTYGGFDKPGVSLGAFVNRQIGNLFLWQMEISYTQRGSKKNMNLKKNDYVFYKMHLDYIEVPIIAIYSFSETLSFNGGITTAVLVNAYEENEFIRFLSNPFYKFAMNTVIGVNYRLSERIEFVLRENYSIRPIRGYAEGGRLWYKTGQFNNSLSFTVNYLF